MQTIPLIRAGVVADIADAVDAHGPSADRMLRDARISPSVRESRLGFVPGRSVWTFAAADERLREGRTSLALEPPRRIDSRLHLTTACHFRPGDFRL